MKKLLVAVAGTTVGLAVLFVAFTSGQQISKYANNNKQADEICYSLLKDWSEQPAMRDKVRQATADNFFSDDECQDLLKYHTMIDEQAKRQRMDAYMDEAKDNVK